MRSTKSKMNFKEGEKNTRQKEFINVRTYSRTHMHARALGRTTHTHMDFKQIDVSEFSCVSTTAAALSSFHYCYYFYIHVLTCVCACMRHKLMYTHACAHI